MPKPTTDSPIMNVAQAAAFLGAGKDLLYELAARDEIPHCPVVSHESSSTHQRLCQRSSLSPSLGSPIAIRLSMVPKQLF